MTVTRLGVCLPQVGPWSAFADELHWAEDVGYDVAYTYDHLTHFTVPGQYLADGIATLAAAAVATDRLELGTLVASATLHSPVALARLAATVQDVSGGRFVLGLGSGSPHCALADRGASPTAGQMFARYRDVVIGYRAVMSGATEMELDTRSFAGVETLPLPDGVAAPPLVLAAHGPKALALAAEHGDGWNTYGGPGATRLEPADFWAEIEAQVARFAHACTEVGRDPATVRRSLLLGFGTVLPATSVAAYEEAAERAGALGFDELVVYGPHAAGGDRFVSDPAVHEQAVSRIRR